MLPRGESSAPAATLKSHVLIFASQMGLPMASPYEGVQPNNFITGRLNIGEAKRIEFSQTSPLATEEEAGRAFGGSHPLYVIGYIHYRDESTSGVLDNVIWRLAFCREWSVNKKSIDHAPPSTVRAIDNARRGSTGFIGFSCARSSRDETPLKRLSSRPLCAKSAV